jgi:hypothetical protein
MNPTLKPPGTQRLNLQSDVLLSSFAFNFILRRCHKDKFKCFFDISIGGEPAGRDLHSFPFPLNLSLLRPFPLNLAYLAPHMTQINPWMCPEDAQVEL